MLNGVNNNSSATYVPPAQQTASVAATTTTNENSAEAAVYTPSAEQSKKVYTYSKQSLIEARDRNNMNAFKDMVRSLLTSQGKLASFGDIDLGSQEGILKLKDLIDGGMEVDAATAGSAQALIGEGGAFSVEAVSDRLVEFAISVSGGDKANYEKMKSAIEAGFKEAEKLWGGKLPDISYQTYDATMQKLDDWYNGE